MIISRTPLRVSFVGGGTDLREYYKTGKGAVLSTTINKYMYVTVNKKFDDKIRVSYSKTELVDNVDQLEHGIIREAMKKTGVTKGIEITTIADIPAKGTGLGSSSSLAVGILHALYAYKGQYVSAEKLAKEAYEIETEKLGEPIGKQDQYAAAYGGLNIIQFNADDSVFVEPLVITKLEKESLEKNIMMFYTGINRPAGSILSEQKKNTADKKRTLDSMRDMAFELKKELVEKRFDKLGEMLHRGWEMKKQLAGGISNPEIDAYYNKAIQAGAIGGKLLGAGGGGFLLFYIPKEKQNSVRKALSELREMNFTIEPQGSKIIFVGD